MGNIEFETPECPECGYTTLMSLPQEQVDSWKFNKDNPMGKKIQEVFPDLDEDQRELILTGTHPECWDSLFEDDDDDGFATTAF